MNENEFYTMLADNLRIFQHSEGMSCFKICEKAAITEEEYYFVLTGNTKMNIDFLAKLQKAFGKKAIDQITSIPK